MKTIDLFATEAQGVKEQVNVIPTIDNVDFNRDYLFTNLDYFAEDDENRKSEIDDTTVQRYKKLMMAGEWFYELSPIFVGIRSLKIFNGEHRRKAINAAVEKGMEPPIIHIRFFDDTVKRKEKRDALNSGKHWICDDYVESLIGSGNKDFEYLKQFCLDEDHPQLHSKNGKPYYGKGAIVFGSTYAGFKDGYLTGQWNVKREDIATSEKRYAEIVRIKKCLGFDNKKDYWIYLGEAWYSFSNNSGYSQRLKNLPNGVETFFDYLQYEKKETPDVERTKPWLDLMINTLIKAERKNKC